MKQFIKTIGRRNSRGFDYIVEKFPKITRAKLKQVIFVVPQIGEVLNLKATLTEPFCRECSILGLLELLGQQEGNGLQGQHQESFEMLLCNGVSWILICISLRRTLEQYQVNMANDFTRLLVLWRNGAKVSAMTVCQPATSGHYTVINRLTSIVGKPDHSVSNSVIL